jgi:hypothetical protein
MVPDDCAMTEKTRKARVTDENLAEAKKLKKLYDGEPHKGNPGGLTQAAFGATYNIGAQSVVWQYLNGRIPLNLRAATGFAKGLKCKISDFSPRLAAAASAVAEGEPKSEQEKVHSLVKLHLLDLTQTEAQLVALYRDLDDDRRADVMQHVNKLHNKVHERPSPANPFPAASKRKRKEEKESN